MAGDSDGNVRAEAGAVGSRTATDRRSGPPPCSLPGHTALDGTHTRARGTVVLAARSAGCIINTCGFVEGVGYQALMHAADAFQGLPRAPPRAARVACVARVVESECGPSPSTPPPPSLGWEFSLSRGGARRRAPIQRSGPRHGRREAVRRRRQAGQVWRGTVPKAKWLSLPQARVLRTGRAQREVRLCAAVAPRGGGGVRWCRATHVTGSVREIRGSVNTFTAPRTTWHHIGRPSTWPTWTSTRSDKVRRALRRRDARVAHCSVAVG